MEAIIDSQPQRSDRRARVRNRRLSTILRRLAGDETRERIAVADLFEAMQDRAIGALMLIFALPNLVPTPPGTSAILGAPLVFLSAQMMLGLKAWLPQTILKRSLQRQDFEAVVRRIAPWLARAEKMTRPRLGIVLSRPVECLAGLLCLVLAVVLTLPIPLGNILPAFAISLFAFAMLGRDGLFSLAGFGLGLISLVLVAGVVWGLAEAAFYVLARWF